MEPAKPVRKLGLAKAMRKAPVSTEALLWSVLRDRRLEGLKFRRQVPLGRYVADFVCFRHRLIVEADGPWHEDSLSDQTRDAWLKMEGFRVLRFGNNLIHNHGEKVLAAVMAATTPAGPSSPPRAGEAR